MVALCRTASKTVSTRNIQAKEGDTVCEKLNYYARPYPFGTGGYQGKIYDKNTKERQVTRNAVCKTTNSTTGTAKRIRALSINSKYPTKHERAHGENNWR